MIRDIAEADWKVFRGLHPVALDRFCARVLAEVQDSLAAAGQTNHQRYQALYKLIRERDREVAEAFNDSRRSTALLQLTIIQSRDLLTAEEMQRFSQQTRDAVELLDGIRR